MTAATYNCPRLLHQRGAMAPETGLAWVAIGGQVGFYFFRASLDDNKHLANAVWGQPYCKC